MDQEKDHCLICHEDLSRSKDLGFKCDDGAAPDNRSGINDQLNVIFILRKLLHIPTPTLEEFLKVSGGENPDRWICLCEDCEGLVASARKHFDEFISAARKFKEAREQIVRTLKDSLKGKSGSSITPIKIEDEEEDIKIVKIRDLVTQKSRDFVRQHDYGHGQDLSPIITNILSGTTIQSQPVSLQIPDQTDPLLEDDYTSMSSPMTPSPQVTEDSTGGVSPGGNRLEEITPFSKVKQEEEETASFGGNEQKKTQESWRRKPKKRLIDEEGAFVGEGGRVMFKCCQDSCGKVFQNIRWHRIHKLKHSGGERRKFKCNLCDDQFLWNEGLQKHVKRVHEKIQTIPKPQKKLSEEEKLKIKARNRRSCPHCGKVMDKYTVPKHIRLVHEKKHRLSCELCGLGVSSKRGLCKHQVEIHKICSVEECKQAFESREQLHQHQVSTHGKEINVFRCPECDKCFMARSNLRDHLRVHDFKKKLEEKGEDAREFFCDLCGKRFVLENSLKYHKKWIHLTPRQRTVPLLSCEVCGRGFSCKKELSIHQSAVHKICSVEGCKQTFESREQLHHHQVDTHGKEIDTFLCPECGKLFRMKYRRNHLRGHEYEKRLKEEGDKAKKFVCDLCGNRFGMREHLHHHKWAVHEKGRKQSKKNKL